VKTWSNEPSGWIFLQKLNYKSILFLTNPAFNVAALCTTSAVRFLLPPQMKQATEYNKTKSCNMFWNAKMLGVLRTWWIYSHNKTTQDIRNSKNKNETNTSFTIDHDKFQQLLFFTANMMFINLLENKLCSNFRVNLTVIIRTFNSVFVLLVQNFLCGGPLNHCAFDNKCLYIMNQRKWNNAIICIVLGINQR
jgi:hypothetical protein